MNFTNYIKEFQQFARLGLERMEQLAFHLDNPQDKLHVIHVAGTNGKGSVCTLISSVLVASGYKVGKYLSPELNRVNERISINGVDISDDELEQLLGEIQPVVDKVNIEMNELPSRFEVSTAAALKYFADKKCDFVILETGLGGRLDATNICKKPLVSVITTIDIDHAEYLGDTISKIAFEKAGIIKEGVPCVSAVQYADAEDVIRAVCKSKNITPIFCDANSVINNGFSGMNEKFSYKFRDDLMCGLSGVHQMINTIVALDVIDVLIDYYGFVVAKSAVYEGIKTARNKARMELLCENPYIIFDGAHNLSGTKALVNSLKRYFEGEKFTFVVAMMQDKDCNGMINTFSELANKFIATQVPENPRALLAQNLYNVINEMGFNATCEKDLNRAIALAKTDDKVIICGSLYYYKYVREIMSNLENHFIP